MGKININNYFYILKLIPGSESSISRIHVIVEDSIMVLQIHRNIWVTNFKMVTFRSTFYFIIGVIVAKENNRAQSLFELQLSNSFVVKETVNYPLSHFLFILIYIGKYITWQISTSSITKTSSVTIKYNLSYIYGSS